MLNLNHTIKYSLKLRRHTPEFLNKKHQNCGQGLEFLKFGQGNRGLNQQNRRKSKEIIRNNNLVEENNF